MDTQILQQFLRFKQGYTGNAKDEVMRLVQSGKMSQEQLNQLQQMATQIQQMMK